MPDEIIMDMTPEEARARVETQQVLVGDDDEIKQMEEFYNKDLLSDGATPTSTDVTPQVPTPPPAVPETVDVDGVQVPVRDLINIHKFKSANDRRAGELAAERRAFEAQRIAHEAERAATEQRILNLLNERIPAPPAAPPKLVEVDLSDVPDVDFSTFEGQERAKDWVVRVAQKAATAARDEARQALPPPAPFVASAPFVPPPPPEVPVTEHNASVGRQFLAPEILSELGVDQDKGLQYLQKIDAMSPASPDGRWSLNEVRVLARRFQEMETHAAQTATEADVRARLEAAKKAQDGSNVLRGGGAPAARGLTFSQVSKMSDAELRRLIGPMKGRGGPKGMGIEVVDKVMRAMEGAGMDISPR